MLPLSHPNCGGPIHLMAFITHSVDILQIPDHIGVVSDSPHISPEREPPLRGDCDAQRDDGVKTESDGNLVVQPRPITR